MADIKEDTILTAVNLSKLRAEKVLLKARIFGTIALIIFAIYDWRLGIGIFLLSKYVDYKIAWVLFDIQANLIESPIGQAVELIQNIKNQKGNPSEN